MSRCLGLVALMVFVALPAQAQRGYPGTEIYLGYSYRPDGSGAIDREVAHGWSASISHNFNRWFGLTSDFGGEYGNADELLGAVVPLGGLDFTNYQFLFGPRITIRTNRVTLFTHVLVGVALTTTPSFTDPTGTPVPSDVKTDFATGYGAGLDVNLIPFLAWRLIQFDHVPVRVNDTWVRANRLRTGIVLKF